MQMEIMEGCACARKTCPLSRLPDEAFLIQPVRGAGKAPHGRGRAHLKSDPLARRLHDGGARGACLRHASRMAAHSATSSAHSASRNFLFLFALLAAPSSGAAVKKPAFGAAVGKLALGATGSKLALDAALSKLSLGATVG